MFAFLKFPFRIWQLPPSPLGFSGPSGPLWFESVVVRSRGP